MFDNIIEKIRTMTIDEINGDLAYVAYRARYCIACGKETSRADAQYEDLLLRELARRERAEQERRDLKLDFSDMLYA